MSKFTATIVFDDLNALKALFERNISLLTISEERLPLSNYTVKSRAFKGQLVYTMGPRNNPVIDIEGTLKQNNVTRHHIDGSRWPTGSWQNSLKRAIARA